MVIRVIGSSFRLTPPSSLQAVVADRAAIFARLLELKEEGRLQGAVLLATCNRIDIILDVPGGDAPALPEAILGAHVQLPHHDHSDEAATHYLLRVATGLESMVCGEEQILGQIRDAVKAAEQHGLLSPVLRVFIGRLVAAARDTRQKAGITGSKVSVAAQGARHLTQFGRRFVVVGAGQTGRLAVDTLVRRGCTDILVVNRTLDKARALAEHYGVQAMGLAEFLAAAEDAGEPWRDWDGVLFAVDSDQPMFFPRHARGCKVAVDISLPSVLDRSLESVPGLEILDLDGLARLVQEESARRQSKHRLAESMVAGRAKSLFQLVVEADTKTGLHLARIPAIHLENAMQDFDAALATKLEHLSERDKETVRRLLMKTVKRNAHLHLKDVRELCSARAVSPTRHAQRGEREPAVA